MPDHASPNSGPTSRPPRRWVRYVLALVSLAIASLWVYAFFFASKQAVGRVDDRAWARRGEDICRVANDDRAELIDTRRIDEVGPDALTERAAIIDQATDIVEQMLDDVLAVEPSGPDDPALVASWARFYRQLVDDRRAYADVLRSGENEPFREAAEDGAPISEWINDFAIVNEMNSCSAPLDLSI